MSVNFFQQACRDSSEVEKFGLCDDENDGSAPAYIDEFDPTIWIGIVENPNLKLIDFFAIDNCVELNKPDGRQDSRCDGLLKFDNMLIFVELKSRDGGKWLKKGRMQLINTINRFKAEVDVKQYDNISAYVCNNQRPLSNVMQAESIQIFKDATGYILRGQQIIRID